MVCYREWAHLVTPFVIVYCVTHEFTQKVMDIYSTTLNFGVPPLVEIYHVTIASLLSGRLSSHSARFGNFR